jgi:hypothetical protein
MRESRLAFVLAAFFLAMTEVALPAEDLPPRPDLAVVASEIIFPKTTLLEDMLIQVEIMLRILGNGEASRFDVQVFDLFMGRNQLLTSFSIASLPSSSSAALTFNWKPKDQGIHIVRVLIDPEGRIQESDRTNNVASREVLVLSELQVWTNLYTFALSYLPSNSFDRKLLEAERKVFLEPQNLQAQDELLRLAVDWRKEKVVVIGLGLRPFYVVSDPAAQPLAKRSAQLNAQRWLSWIRQKRTKTEGRTTKDQIFGAKILAEQVLPDGSYLIKVEATLP